MPRPLASSTKTAAVKAAAKKAVSAKKQVKESVSQVDRKVKPYGGILKGSADKGPKPTESEHFGGYVREGLEATDRPGVFINSVGTECDYRGIAIALLKAAKKSQEQAEIEVLGHVAKDPVDVLRFGALDRSLPLGVRLEAAKGAAPYTNRKMPMAVDGGADPNNPNGPGLPINIGDLKGLTDKELASLKALLEKTKSAAE